MQVLCESCGKKYRVPEKHVGKKFACRKCGSLIRTLGVVQDEEDQVSDPPVLHPAPTNTISTTTGSGQGTNVAWLTGGLLFLAVAVVGGYFGLRALTSNADAATTKQGDAVDRIVATHGGVRKANSVVIEGNEIPVAQPESNQENKPEPSRLPDLKETKLFVSSIKPRIQADLFVDPTQFYFAPKHIEEYGIPQGQTIPVGLSFGGPWFLDIYSKGMRIESSDIALDSAIAAANWGHEKELALKTIISKLGDSRIHGQGSERVAYAHRILNTYSRDEIIKGLTDVLMSDDDLGSQFVVELMNEYNLFIPELVDAAVSRGGTIERKSHSADRAFQKLLGYTAEKYSRYSRNFPKRFEANLAPNSEKSPFAIWKHTARNVAFAREYGLDRMPPMITNIRHCNRQEWQPLANGLLKIPDFEKNSSLNEILDQLNLKTESIEYLTTGWVEANGIPHWNSPRLTIIKLNKPKFDRTDVQKGLIVAGGNAVGLIKPDMVIVGTRNEVQWAVEKGGNDYVHPAAYQWPELNNAQYFSLKEDAAEIFRLQNNGKHVGSERLSMLRAVDANHRKELLEGHREYLKETNEKREMQLDELRELLNSFKGKIGELSRLNTRIANSRLEKIREQIANYEIILNTPGQLKVEMVEGEDRVVFNSFLVSEAVNTPLSGLFLSDILHKSFVPSTRQTDFPDDEEAMLRHLARSVNANALVDSRRQITRVLKHMLKELDARETPANAKDVMPYLETIYQIRESCAAEHTPLIAQLSKAIQFENDIDQVRWLIACLAPQRDLNAIHEVHQLLQKDKEGIALDVSALKKGEDDKEPPQVLVERIKQTLDELGPQVEYFLNFGNEETKIMCLDIVKSIPPLRDGLRFRIANLQKETNSIQLSVALKDFKPADTIKFKIPFVDEPGAMFELYFSHRQAAELPVDGPAPKFESNEPFEHDAANFGMKVPRFQDREEPFDYYGVLHRIEKRDDESVQEWSDRAEKERKKGADAYQMIEGLNVKIENSDALTVDVLSWDVEEIKRYWESGNAALGKRLIAEKKGDSGADFDRIRIFFIGPTPKAERIIAYRDKNKDDLHNKFGLRWVGRNIKAHPAYLNEILDSFKVKRD